ncbi:hypothetical protein [Pararhodospirillum photometricum]|uniref:hypothetical protein n=1 Tax=Pararhodospirillum photometricum TaxID=1084 RepID=UPI0012FF4C3F|nr:hypothetical protein [Pararhodospirillum photometricum]
MMNAPPFTYATLAVRLGCTPEAARQRARRRGWLVTLDNRGRALVHVPPGELPDERPANTRSPAAERPIDARTANTPTPDTLALVADLRAERDRLLSEVADLRARLDGAEGRARAAEIEAAELRGRLDERERLVRALEGRGWLGKLLG